MHLEIYIQNSAALPSYGVMYLPSFKSLHLDFGERMVTVIHFEKGWKGWVINDLRTKK